MTVPIGAFSNSSPSRQSKNPLFAGKRRKINIGDKSALLAAWIAAALLSFVPIEQSQAQLILTIQPYQGDTNTTLWTFSGSSTADQSIGGGTSSARNPNRPSPTTTMAATELSNLAPEINSFHQARPLDTAAPPCIL